MKILVIENDKRCQKIIKLQLNQLGYSDIDTVATAEDGIVKLVKNNSKYDVIFTDVGLPGLQGTQLISLIRKLVPFHMPIVVTSAHSIHSDIFDACEADLFYQKPFDVGNIEKAMQEIGEINGFNHSNKKVKKDEKK